MKTTILPPMHPEDSAMLHALRSRSMSPIEEHLAKVQSVGSGEFMDKYYIGYNHRSIADNGSLDVFIEDVPILFANTLQHSAMYAGQEASTRFIQMDTARWDLPLQDVSGSWDEQIIDCVEEALSFYGHARGPLIDHLRAGEMAGATEPTLDTRACDVLRGFLPAGTLTSLSLAMRLSSLRDTLDDVTHHPDPHVRSYGGSLRETVRAHCPHSFPEKERDKTRAHLWEENYYLEAPPNSWKGLRSYGFDCHTPQWAWDAIKTRQKGDPVPKELNYFVRTQYLIDYGGFRDLHRHRVGLPRMPLVTAEHGFHPWYLEQLPPRLRTEAEILLGSWSLALQKYSDADPIGAQYGTPLGFLVPYDSLQPLWAWVYRVELRTGSRVHPTVRSAVLEECRHFNKTHPECRLYADDQSADWDPTRGEQTITERL